MGHGQEAGMTGPHETAQVGLSIKWASYILALASQDVSIPQEVLDLGYPFLGSIRIVHSQLGLLLHWGQMEPMCSRKRGEPGEAARCGRCCV